MMRATVDVGTNTVRMLIGECREGRIEPLHHFRRITRLGGRFSPENGLDPAARERTLSALAEAAGLLASAGVLQVRAAGTAVLRAAPDAPRFLEAVREKTGLPLEIISGEEEAVLSARGVLAALEPKPESCFIVDIGGGSTEIILWSQGRIAFSRSHPLGVVALCETCSDVEEEQRRIDACMADLRRDLEGEGFSSLRAPLVGTAGTITTLAAVKLVMTDYDWRTINNTVLTKEELEGIASTLSALPPAERESYPGMEKGRGDLILPGVRIVTGVLELLGEERLIVSDFGLLEGLLLDLCEGGRNR